MASQTDIHPTAIVHPKAVLGEGTRVGPFSVIGEHVVTGRDCDIQEHVVVRGHTTIGDEVKIFPFAAIGGEPQHLRYRGEPTTVEIGNRVTLRESVTVHRGTPFDKGKTCIGDDSFIMAYTHVAHDCEVGRSVIVANASQLAGHVVVEDFVTLGGQTGIAQHCRIGRFCYVGGASVIRKDLAPFLLGKGNIFEIQGINVVGLTRNGFSGSAIRQLKSLYKIFFLQKLTVTQAIEAAVTELGGSDEVKVFLDFVKKSKMGIER